MESILMDIHPLQEFTLLFTNYLFLIVGTLFNTLLLKSVKYQRTALFPSKPAVISLSRIASALRASSLAILKLKPKALISLAWIQMVLHHTDVHFRGLWRESPPCPKIPLWQRCLVILCCSSFFTLNVTEKLASHIHTCSIPRF